MDIEIANYMFFNDYPDYPEDVLYTPPKPVLSLESDRLMFPPSSVPSPMMRPPPEIISRIIELGSEDGQDGFPKLVSHISRWLRDVALGNPTLWSSITIVGNKTSREEISMRLERSKGVPLELVVSGMYTRQDAEDALNLLYPHIDRWKTLDADLRTSQAADAFMHALIDSAPLLESATFSGVSNIHSPVHIFGGKTPSLKSMSVRNVSVLWNSPLLQSLTSLQVHSSACTSPSYVDQWRSLRKLVIRVDPMQQLIMQLPTSTVNLPELESFELNGVSEFNTVQLLSIIELPHLSRMLLTHIKSSRGSPFDGSLNALPSLQKLRLHTTEMSHDNLLKVLAKSQNLESISFEDSSPLPNLIDMLTPTNNPADWLCPNLSSFHVLAFEKDNAPRFYNDTDIAVAIRGMIYRRIHLKTLTSRMRIFAGYRNSQTRHAAPWGADWPCKSDESVCQ
ncbi:hypothetical protein FRB97_009027 [Tulasnella sp. 331]|nr:hypothetical protein FRB97_009027 [Tulasnella sp. 331]